MKRGAEVDKRWAIVERDPKHHFCAVERDEGVKIPGVQTFAHEARSAAGERDRGSALRTQADLREACSLEIGDCWRPRFETDRVAVNAPQHAIRGECLVTMRAGCCGDVDDRDVLGQRLLELRDANDRAVETFGREERGYRNTAECALDKRGDELVVRDNRRALVDRNRIEVIQGHDIFGGWHLALASRDSRRLLL